MHVDADMKLLARRAMSDPSGALLVARVKRRHLTYLDGGALLDLRDCVVSAERRGQPGSIIEAGCALGGSAIVLATSKAAARPMHVFDAFGMIPPPSERDGLDVLERYEEISSGSSSGIGDDTYYGYDPDLLATVKQNFLRFHIDLDKVHVDLVKGLFEDTILPREPVAVAHVDGDWYDSVAVCLDRIWPVLVPGGVMIIDDYDDWSGCRRAVDDFLISRSDVRVERHGRVHLVKV